MLTMMASYEKNQYYRSIKGYKAREKFVTQKYLPNREG